MKYSEEFIKAYIKRYFSDDLRHDASIAGDAERLQLRKWLLTWAKDYTGDPSYLRERALNQPQHWEKREESRPRAPQAVQTGGGWARAEEKK